MKANSADFYANAPLMPERYGPTVAEARTMVIKQLIAAITAGDETETARLSE